MSTWKPIPGYEGYYEASDEGQVRSLDRMTVQNRWLVGRVLKASRVSSGYLAVTLAKDGQRTTRDVHVLVAEAFHAPKADASHVVRHLNGDKLDNRAANLRWGTGTENQIDRIRHGRNEQSLKTHCPQGHPYAGSNLQLRRGNSGRPRRVCAQCNRDRVARYYAKHGRSRRKVRAA